MLERQQQSPINTESAATSNPLTTPPATPKQSKQKQLVALPTPNHRRAYSQPDIMVSHNSDPSPTSVMQIQPAFEMMTYNTDKKKKSVKSKEVESSVSSTNLYPIIHDLSEWEYNNNNDNLFSDCPCSPWSSMMDLMFRLQDDDEDRTGIMPPRLPDISSANATAALFNSTSATQTTTRSTSTSSGSNPHHGAIALPRSRSDEEGRKQQTTATKPPLHHRRVKSEGGMMMAACTTTNPIHHPTMPVSPPTVRTTTTTTTATSDRNSGGTFDEQYVLTRQIFKCDESTVWECVHRATGQRYGVKILKENTIQTHDEIQMLQLAQGIAHVVKLHEVVYENQHVYIVMELQCSNLLSRVVQNHRLSDESQVRAVARQLMEGIHGLHHDLHMSHNNLQPSNILLSSDVDTSQIEIADFGSAVNIDAYQSSSRCAQQQSSTSSKPYRAPEPEQGTAASDMWSIGSVLAFCIFGHDDFGSLKVTSAIHGTFDHDVWNGLSRHAKQFLCGLLHPDPQVRFTAQEALEHKWLEQQDAESEPEEATTTNNNWQSLWRKTEDPTKSPPPPHLAKSQSYEQQPASSSSSPKPRPRHRIVRSLSKLKANLLSGGGKQPELRRCSSIHTDSSETTVTKWQLEQQQQRQDDSSHRRN